MNITINSVKFKADPKLEQFVDEKVGKLDRLVDRINSCEVTMKWKKPESENNKVAEIALSLPGRSSSVPNRPIASKRPWPAV